MGLSKRLVFIVLAVVATALAAAVLVTKDSNEGSVSMPNDTQLTNDGMQIVSPAFKEGEAIPEQYTCRGQNINPPLNFINIPADAQSLALIMHDPDAPVGDFVHWTMWNIPSNTETIAANSVPVGAVQGVTSFGTNKYGGPCPPSGTHRYMFELYALDTSLGLPANTERNDLKKAMAGHIIAQHTLTSTFSAE